MTVRARYMYAVTRPIPDDLLREVTGIRGAPVSTVRDRNLMAVVSDVELREFGEDSVRARLEELAWLEGLVWAHRRGVEEVSVLAPIAPLRLVTTCRDDKAVRDRLVGWHRELVRVLAQVEGRSEWGVKAFVPRPPDNRVAVGAAGSLDAVDRLRDKKLGSTAPRPAGRPATPAAAQIHAAHAGMAVAERRLPGQDPVLARGRAELVLNAAYLVPEGASSAFQGRVQTLREEHPGIRIECRGPWPPYTFALLDHDA
jgi:hypothetical protein